MTARTRQWLAAMLAGSMLGLSAGCAMRLVVIPADKEVLRLPAGQLFTPAIPGWFVPDARMQEMLRELARDPQ